MLATTMFSQANVARCAKVISVRKQSLVSKAAAVPTCKRTPTHVTFGTKVAEAEMENSLKSSKKRKDEDDDDEFEGEDGLSPQQVESLLTVLCEETEIAEVSLKMGGFRMRVRRSLQNGSAAGVVHAAPVAVAPAPAPVAAAPAPAVSSLSSGSYDEDFVDEDESFSPVTTGKVGILRRGRFVKGKQVGKGVVAEVGDTIKSGQAICFVEQLGTYWPIEAPIAGELVAFEIEEGGPVEYKQVVAHIRPSFATASPGHSPRRT